jgi:hypothetical protein
MAHAAVHGPLLQPVDLSSPRAVLCALVLAMTDTRRFAHTWWWMNTRDGLPATQQFLQSVAPLRAAMCYYGRMLQLYRAFRSQLPPEVIGTIKGMIIDERSDLLAQ